jgi:hypothetical protein
MLSLPISSARHEPALVVRRDVAAMSDERPHKIERPMPRGPWRPWTGPAYGSSQERPPAPSTPDQRVPAFLRDIIGAWFGGFEGRDQRKDSYVGGVWTNRTKGGDR